MSYNIKEIFDLYAFPYPAVRLCKNSGEFLVGLDYTPLLTATLETTSVKTLLPIEGTPVPFTLDGNHTLQFDEEWHGHLAKIEQTSQGINPRMIARYMGNKMKLAYREDNMIMDGGTVSISNRGNVDITAGLCCIEGKVMNFAGMQIRTEDQLSALPKGRGLCLSVYIPVKQLDTKQGLIIPKITKTDLISTQIGDYSTMYSVIRAEYGVDYSSLEYIELIRMQMISQSPSTPYISSHIDQRMRQPPIDCYPM